jgi:4-hydroxythreonine-4-phosphate dehydrogenase
MSIPLPRLAITPGEPAGIGPDISLQIALKPIAAHIVAFADPDLLIQRAAQLNLPVKIHPLTSPLAALEIAPHQIGHLYVQPIPLSHPVKVGQLNPANVPYLLETLTQATQSCINNYFDALITGPVHKAVINQAGISFSGHTEFLAHQTGTSQVVMMLATPNLRVALVTTHLPLSQVSAAITPTRLETIIRILHHELQNKLKITHPKILVCGLNPHAGEDGHLGTEENTIIIPTLNKLRATGIQLAGPVPADTAFLPSTLAEIDVVLTMYHDQGLPVLKHQGFGQAINITLGLPILRTSVDHGTALELAGTGRAGEDSLYQAIQMTIKILTS